MSDAAAVYQSIHAEVEEVLIGNEDVIEGLAIALLTRGHVLLEGVPGVAKTTAANLFARTTGLEYTRIQMTPDILPADITGTNIYREATGEFVIQEGPVFANIVVADEINRATPKTQSALLEAMQERTVTIEGDTRSLPEPFMVIATQNPIEMEGTFTLPEAQRDRFQLKLIVDLPERATERELLDRFDADSAYGPSLVQQVVDADDLAAARASVDEVHVEDSIKEYILDLVAATRENTDVEHGASPRASIAFLNTAKARAAIQDRSYVIPDDVKALATRVLVHRLVLSTDAELSDIEPREVVSDILDRVTPPGSETSDEGGSDVGDDTEFDPTAGQASDGATLEAEGVDE